MMENKAYILIFIISVFISSASQILLKKSSRIKYKNRVREYLNAYVISAYSVFVLVTLINIYAFKYIPVSYGAVLESLGYVFVAVLDRIVFKEKVTARKCAGLIFIISGAVIVCA